MKKGKLGIAYAFYAIAAFVFAYFTDITPLLLLLGLVLLVEEDNWTTKMCVQAVGVIAIRLAVSVVFNVLRWPVNWIGQFITDYESSFYDFTNVYDKILYFMDEAVDVAILVFTVIAILNLIKEKDAKFPIAEKIADMAMGQGRKKCPKCGAVVKGKFCDQCGANAEE